MDKIGNYSGYVKTYSSVREETGIRRESTEKTGETSKTGESERKAVLSEDARELLKELQKKYGNMDFIVADYETEEEAAAYLSRGTKEYSVLIEPETLEQMAADEAVKNQYTGIIEDATSQLAQMKTKLGEDGEEVTHLGVSIGDDGTTTFFADLEKLSEKQRERIEKSRTEKKEETKKEEAQRDEKTKKTRVSAQTVEELMEKIQNVDWSRIRETKPESGSRIDYSV